MTRRALATILAALVTGVVCYVGRSVVGRGVAPIERGEPTSVASPSAGLRGSGSTSVRQLRHAGDSDHSAAAGVSARDDSDEVDAWNDASPYRGNSVLTRMHPRATEEWQGMLVDIATPAMCDVSARCGLALACIDGFCLPCGQDSDCAPDERCVLDHCVLAKNVGCRGRHDCAAGVLCVLSGLSEGLRGNATMDSHCEDQTVPLPEREAPADGETDGAKRPPSTAEQLLLQLDGVSDAAH